MDTDTHTPSLTSLFYSYTLNTTSKSMFAHSYPLGYLLIHICTHNSKNNNS